jgi:hypothetical protein
MKKLLIITIIAAMSMSVTSVSAQSEGKKYDNPQWKNIVFVDYKSGMANDARELIAKYHAKATEMSGTSGPEMVLEMNSGEWDLMIIWGFEGGISDMDWEVNPNGAKWRKAMNELAGGADEAQAIMDKYNSMVSRSSNQIARVRN